jgi:hypothetical protein
MSTITAQELLKNHAPINFPQTLESNVENGLFVEFTNISTGKVVNGTEEYPVGYESNTWDISSFKNNN